METGAVSVIATASSPAYPVVVTASAGTNTAQLPLVGGNIFMGSLRLTGLPEGPATVTVTAAEMPPGTGSATTQITIIHDIPPKLDVIAPTWNADFSANGTLHVTVTCTPRSSGSACGPISINANNMVLAQFSGPTVDQDVPFTLTGDILLRFQEIDAVGTKVVVQQVIFYEPAGGGHSRFRAAVGDFVNAIGSLIERDGTVYLLIGRSVYAVDAVPACPFPSCSTSCGVGGSGGATDAGVDAGTDASVVCIDAGPADAGPGDAGAHADAGAVDGGGADAPGPGHGGSGGCGGCEAPGSPGSCALLALAILLVTGRLARTRARQRVDQ